MDSNIPILGLEDMPYNRQVSANWAREGNRMPGPSFIRTNIHRLNSNFSLLRKSFLNPFYFHSPDMNIASKQLKPFSITPRPFWEAQRGWPKFGLRNAGRVFAVVQSWLLVFVFVPMAFGQDFPGNDDLDEAFDKKIKAQTTRDLDGVVKLCKSAIEKGLDEEGTVQAKQLAASASWEHAEQLSNRIFGSATPDPRWQKFRTEAIQQLEQATEFQPDMIRAYVLIARLNLLPNGDVDAARKAIDKAVENAGEDRAQLSSALFYRASLSEDKEAQLADINQALKINPDNLDALRFRAVYYLSQKDIEKGLEDINKWLEGENTKPDDFLGTIVLLRAMGSSFDEQLQEEALKLIDRGLELAPEDYRFLEQRAEIHVLRKDFAQSIADVTKLLELAEADANGQARKFGYWLMRAGLYQEQEKYDESLADYDAVLKVNPNALPAIEGKAMALVGKSDFAAAIREYNKIRRRSSGTRPNLMRQIGMLHNANEEPSKAIEIYNELLELFAEEKFTEQSDDDQRVAESERQLTWRARGDAYLSLGQHKEAIEDYTKVLQIHQSNQEFAQQDLEQKIPDDEHSLNNLAWVLATSPVDELRDGKRAVELATKAAEATEYKEAYILSTLASAYAESGDFEAAIKWIKKAIEINEQERAEKETERNLEQKESLHKELEHYTRNEPFREIQNVEKEKAEKAEKAKADQETGEPENAEPGKSEGSTDDGTANEGGSDK
jgi:tetratricopeptide (TPR) repeat protein